MEYPSDTIEKITELLFRETKEMFPCDIAIVMGNDFLGTMEDVFRLYKNGTIRKKIIITGHSAKKDREPEAVRFFNYGVKLGIPKDMMVLEIQATNSYENLEFSKQVIEDGLGGFSSFDGILFIGKAFVLRRLYMTAKSLQYPQEDRWCFYGTVDKEGRNISAKEWFLQEVSTQRVLEELVRIGQYSLKGDLSLF